jgi:DnaJ like chaperone protein
MKRNRGKLFGAALGFSFGGPIGALLGTAIGHLVDISDDGGGPGPALNQSNENLTFITSLVYLLVGTARADGQVTEEELAAVKNFFRQQLGYGQAHMLVIERILNAAAERDIRLEEACADISSRTVYEERLFLVRLCYEVALSDRMLNGAEDAFIGNAARSLGITEYDFMMVRRTFVESDAGTAVHDPGKRDPYAVLGVEPGSSMEQVQRAYRELALKYHPDKVSHLGGEFIELANRKFTEIQAAYDLLVKGWR